MNFFKNLSAAARKNKSLVCLGIDPDISKIPAAVKGPDRIYDFFKEIIDVTSDLVCAYKPNSAFFEARGIKGLDTLKKIVDYIPANIPVILDAKRGDIGHTARAYAQAAFEFFGADALTVNPYLGFEALEPFLEYKGKGIFVLCVTTNKGSREFQKSGRPPLFEKVARSAVKFNKYRNIGLVVGATRPEEMKIVRKIAPEIPFLVPGIGAQKGDLQKTLQAGWAEKYFPPLIINASRSLTYVSGGSDYAVGVRRATEKLKSEINRDSAQFLRN